MKLKSIFLLLNCLFMQEIFTTQLIQFIGQHYKNTIRNCIIFQAYIRFSQCYPEQKSKSKIMYFLLKCNGLTNDFKRNDFADFKISMKKKCFSLITMSFLLFLTTKISPTINHYYIKCKEWTFKNKTYAYFMHFTIISLIMNNCYFPFTFDGKEIKGIRNGLKYEQLPYYKKCIYFLLAWIKCNLGILFPNFYKNTLFSSYKPIEITNTSYFTGYTVLGLILIFCVGIQIKHLQKTDPGTFFVTLFLLHDTTCFLLNEYKIT